VKSAFLFAVVPALVLTLVACDDDKSDLVSRVLGDASAKPATSAVAAVYDAAPPPPTVKKPIVCAPGPAVDFHGNVALEAEVRRKLQRDAGTITQADLKTIKSINLSQAQTDTLDPCVIRACSPSSRAPRTSSSGAAISTTSRRWRRSRSSSRSARR
jgi:hypothetical protein